jgi:hypothetical protein
MSTPDQRSNFEVIYDTLLEMDPETRHHVIGAMLAIRELPVPDAVRILAKPAPAPRPLIVPFG